MAVVTGIMTVTRKNPVAAAMFLVMHFFSLSGLYLTLQAQLLAILQILVYAGAIMVLVVFVIMLLNLGDETKLSEKTSMRTVLGSGLAVVVLTQLGFVFSQSSNGAYRQISDKAFELGTVQSVGQTMFTQYIFPFEAISLLLLVAVVGSIVLAKKKYKLD